MKTSVRDKKEKQPIFTAETLGVVLILFSALALVCLITREKVFSVPGQYVNWFLLGCFGYFSYVVLLFTAFYGILKIAGKKTGISRKRKFLIFLGVFSVAVLIHAITMHGKSAVSYGEYLSACYNMAKDGISSSSGGGVIVGLVAYLFTALLTDVGAYVVLSIILVIEGYFIYKEFSNKTVKSEERATFNSTYKPETEDKSNSQEQKVNEGLNLNNSETETKKSQTLYVANYEDFVMKSKKELRKENVKEGDGLKFNYAEKGLGVASVQTYSSKYADDIKSKLDYVKTPAPIDINRTLRNSTVNTNGDVGISRPIPTVKEENNTEMVNNTPAIPLYEHDESNASDIAYRAENFQNKYIETEEFGDDNLNKTVEPEETVREINESDLSFSNEEQTEDNAVNYEQVEESPEFIQETDEPVSEEQEYAEFNDQPSYEEDLQVNEPTQEVVEEPVEPIINRDKRIRNIFLGEEKPQEKEKDGPMFESRMEADNNSGVGFGFNERQKPTEPVNEEPPKPPKEIPPINREYFRPPLDLLETYSQVADVEGENHEERMEIIKNTLESFHITATPETYVQGPTITRYEIMMPPGVTVKKVLSYDDDLRMRLSSPSGVRIEAPIPGKDRVGIEVANKHKLTVGLKSIMEDLCAEKEKDGALIFALGKTLVGKSKSDNLAKGPHFLVAGATGSGKSVCLNVMIVSMIMRYSPEELRLILIDPKRVGFRIYEHLPHLMIDEIITEPKKAVAALQWAYEEMERRYQTFTECNVGDIEAFNKEVACDTVAKMPRIVVIVDELADLMETAKKDMESKIRAIAQKARAAGIHLVLATQRPSVDIVTGTIKANLPSRIALRVMNFQDSQTILSEAGAEKLLGNGDMLYKNSSMAECERYQGAWISDREINNVVSYIIEKNKAYFDDDLADYLENAVHPKQEESTLDLSDDGSGEMSDANSELLKKALAFAINSGSISISQVQRRFQIGYIRAAGLVDKMEELKYISGNEGSKARRVFITREEFEQLYGPMTD